tara:strand:- start:675 stop:1484 length:810 start_codon:yes stop_codon:yes gene_type:complete
MTEEQTLSMEPVTNTEFAEEVSDLSNEEKDSLLIGEDMERQQDNLLAGKYQNAQELEKAYKELEGKLGEKSDEVSEDEEVEYEEDSEEEYEEEHETADNILDELWEQANVNELNEETFKELENMSPIDVAKLAMQQRQQLQNNMNSSREFTEEDVTQIHGLVGGEENYNNLLGWANENVPEQEVQLFDTVMEQGNPLAAYFAVQAMALRYQDAAGKEGEMITGKAPKTSGDVFNSQAELIKAMEDDRYNDDPAYRDAIQAKLERSNINF